MEGSESEAIFESFNLKPKLFINDALNSVDDLVDAAFHQFHLEASRLLKTDETNRSQDLQKGIDSIHHVIQTSLDERLSMWEKYCLRNCFTVPSGFQLPSEDELSGIDPMDQDDQEDKQVEANLDILRSKLNEAGKECAELKEELQELENKSTMSNQYFSSVNEALQLYEQNSTHDMFQEMLRAASELRQKMEQLKSKQMEDDERRRREKANDANEGMPFFLTSEKQHNEDIPECCFNTGLMKSSLDDLQEFMSKTNF